MGILEHVPSATFAELGVRLFEIGERLNRFSDIKLASIMGKLMIRISGEPSAEELKKLDECLENYNVQKTGIDDAKKLGLTVYDSETLIGGLNGLTSFGWLYIETLWLDEDYRNRGIGKELLQAAEKEALRRGCQRACLTSFTFQAKPFYEKHGYEVFGQLDDYPEGEKMYFMRKIIKDS